MAHKALIFATLLIIIFTYLPGIFGSGESVHSGDLLIYEVSPSSYPKSHMDYVCLINRGNQIFNLSGTYITDFEGEIRLSGELKPGNRYYVAENSTSFIRYMGFAPNLVYPQHTRFALSNTGDEVALFENGKIEDIVVYGRSSYSGAGWTGSPVNITTGHVLRRETLDYTNSSRDWTNFHRIGQSDFKEMKSKSRIEIFAFPDSSNEVIRYLHGARKRVQIETYTFTSLKIERTLENLTDVGVNVSILLEGQPVGSIPLKEMYVVEHLYEKGANIYFMDSGGGRHARYIYIHSKFIVRDEKDVLVSTENLDVTSMEPCGNRGYGVIVHDTKMATYFEDIFKDDTKRVQDIKQYRGEYKYVTCNFSHRLEAKTSHFNPVNLTAALETVIAPDYALQEFDKFADSENDFYVEALYIKDYALSKLYHKTNAILAEHTIKGYNMKKFHVQGLRLLHAKLVIGTESILVGSMNLGLSSMTKNREASLIIHGKNAVSFFKKVFLHDLNGGNNGLSIIKISKKSNGIWVSIAPTGKKAKEYRIYVDNKLVYDGKNSKVKINVNPGTHTVKCITTFEDGTKDTFIRKIEVESPKKEINIKYLLVILVFAGFLYKIWKRKG